MARVYMYSLYERIWHWSQAVCVLLLILTGVEIHAPAGFAVFGFEAAFRMHRVLGIVLVINAFLGLFYHLSSGAIRRFVPTPGEFVALALKQAAYYVNGIFHRHPHPVRKTKEARLNPLQQITYLAILNILLPLQVVTGILMMQLDVWPEIGGAVGGLAVLGPIHTICAWLFGAFLLLHVYLTTTGRKPLTHLTAMFTGWEDVHESESEEARAS